METESLLILRTRGRLWLGLCGCRAALVLRKIWTVPALPISSFFTKLPLHFQIHHHSSHLPHSLSQTSCCSLAVATVKLVATLFFPPSSASWPGKFTRICPSFLVFAFVSFFIFHCVFYKTLLLLSLNNKLCERHEINCKTPFDPKTRLDRTRILFVRYVDLSIS